MEWRRSDHPARHGEALDQDLAPTWHGQARRSSAPTSTPRGFHPVAAPKSSDSVRLGVYTHA